MERYIIFLDTSQQLLNCSLIQIQKAGTTMRCCEWDLDLQPCVPHRAPLKGKLEAQLVTILLHTANNSQTAAKCYDVHSSGDRPTVPFTSSMNYAKKLLKLLTKWRKSRLLLWPKKNYMWKPITVNIGYIRKCMKITHSTQHIPKKYRLIYINLTD